MGTCCASCLPTKIRDYASNAENGAVTVTVIENPPKPSFSRLSDVATKAVVRWFLNLPMCDVCSRSAEFAVSYHPRKK